jgi:HK97 family phage portal protein
MALFNNILGNRETRDGFSLENPSVSLTDPRAFELIFGAEGRSFSGEQVNEATALGVPAVRCAVNTIAGALSSIPLQLFRKANHGPVKSDRDPLYRILHDVVNEDMMTSFAWRKWMFTRLLLGGRAFTFIERNTASGKVTNLWPLDPTKVTVRKDGFKRIYEFEPATGPKVIYQSNEIIDLALELGSDGFTHISPIYSARNAIGVAIAACRYQSITFENGGVPSLVMTGPIASPAGAVRAGSDISEGLRRQSREKRNVMFLPPGFDIKPVGFDPEKTQLLEAQKFAVIEIARVYNIPPTLLHDLTNGTYSNTEQGSLAFVKNTLMPIAEMFEQEINTKLFLSVNNRNNFAELNMEGLLRGDFPSRMKGYQSAIYSGVLTMNEARAMENRPDLPGGDELFVQSGTMPIQSLPAYNPAAGDVPITPSPLADPGEGDVLEDDEDRSFDPRTINNKLVRVRDILAARKK